MRDISLRGSASHLRSSAWPLHRALRTLSRQTEAARSVWIERVRYANRFEVARSRWSSRKQATLFKNGASWLHEPGYAPSVISDSRVVLNPLSSR